MYNEKDKIKVLINKMDCLESKLNQLQQLLLDELPEEDLYIPYPSFNSSNSIDILINTVSLIIE